MQYREQLTDHERILLAESRMRMIEREIHELKESSRWVARFGAGQLVILVGILIRIVLVHGH